MPVTDKSYGWVIVTDGHVRRSDKVAESDYSPSLPNPDYAEPPYYQRVEAPMPYGEKGYENAEFSVNFFPEREGAYTFKEKLIDAYPTYFLAETNPELFADPLDDEGVDNPSPKKEPRRRNFSQEEFQRLARVSVFKYYKVFWNAFTKLPPKSQCEIYLKMASFGFAKAPSLKPMDEEAQKRKQDRKQAEVADAIKQGLPQMDTNFEEDEE